MGSPSHNDLSADAPREESYAIGTRVYSPEFGNGVITGIDRDEDTALIEVMFQTSGVKRLSAAAPLLAGWDEAETDRPISRTARELKRTLFGDDLTADDVAYVLDLDRTTILRYLREGVILGYQKGREWYVQPDELAAYKQRMLEEKRSEADRQRRLTALEAKRDRLAVSYPERAQEWRVGICTQCEAPLLLSWDPNDSRWDERCPECQTYNWVEAESEPKATASSTDFDNMPF